MQSEWMKVYSSSFLHKVEFIKVMLEENDIESVIINKKDSSYLFGEIELYVQNVNVIKANLLITQNEEQSHMN